ncbi:MULTISPECIES: hypothetical protein [unclassified Streptomyces]|uniref:hypothetical protein n=1 Tax=unclassified Streptomyces TaxID=2593676 RepID=UPI002E2D620F|nr:hypothetical protein [Streptomyces sp. NBC_00223]
MPHSFQLLLVKSSESAHVYSATYGQDVPSFLLLDEATGTVQVCDGQGNPIGDMMLRAGTGNVENPVDDPVEAEKFTMASAHLLSRWRKTGAAPAEIVKFFS